MENRDQSLVLTTSGITDTVELATDKKKEWTAPELKKIDIQEITAAGDNLANDSVMTSS